MKKWQKYGLYGLLVLVILAVIGKIFEPSESKMKEQQEEQAVKEVKPSVGVTLENFNKLQVGITTKDEAIALLGTDYQDQTNRNDGYGVVENFIWRKNGSDTSITIIFWNGKIKYAPTKVNL